MVLTSRLSRSSSITMSGHVGDLSRMQEEALRQFREAVSEIPNKPEEDDYYYLRWLRARKFNVKKAEEMFRKHMEFREKYGLDTILTDYEPPEVLQKYLPGGFFGEDREGHPVWYDVSGNIDARGLHRSVVLDDLLKNKGYRLEQCHQLLREQSKKHGRRIETETIVLDFENLSIQRHYYWPAIDMLKVVLAAGEANAPEITHAVFIINAPSIFPMGYNLIKHLLDEITRKKIHVLGSNWKEELQKYISPDQLPQAYGGTRCEPDPYCSNYINQGGDIPEKYYMTNMTSTDRDSMERVVIGRCSTHKVTLEVDKCGSIIQWEFVSSQHDIAFGIYQQAEKQSGKKHKNELIAMQRKQSHVVPETGSHVCETIGTYILKFDNSYSWSRSKELFYSIKLLPPGAKIEESKLVASGSPSHNPSPCSSHSNLSHDCSDAVENGDTGACSDMVENSDTGACGIEFNPPQL